MIRIAGMGTGLCYAANNTRRFHACSNKTNGPRRTILDDRASAIRHDRKVGVQRTENEPTHERPENTAQTALPPNPELRSGGKRTSLRGTKRKYVQDSYHTIIILDSAIALTPKQLLVGIWLLSRCQPTSQEGLRNISRSKLNATIHEPLI